MPVGELLIKDVARLLSVSEPKTIKQIHEGILGVVSKRAVRYAIDILISKGRAKRLGHKNQHYRVVAVERLREQAAPKG